MSVVSACCPCAQIPRGGCESQQEKRDGNCSSPLFSFSVCTSFLTDVHVFFSPGRKHTNDTSSSCFSSVPLSLYLPLPSCFLPLLHTHISGCLVTFLLLARSLGRHDQSLVLGQQPAGNHWVLVSFSLPFTYILPSAWQTLP